MQFAANCQLHRDQLHKDRLVPAVGRVSFNAVCGKLSTAQRTRHHPLLHVHPVRLIPSLAPRGMHLNHRLAIVLAAQRALNVRRRLPSAWSLAPHSRPPPCVGRGNSSTPMFRGRHGVVGRGVVGILVVRSGSAGSPVLTSLVVSSPFLAPCLLPALACCRRLLVRGSGVAARPTGRRPVHGGSP